MSSVIKLTNEEILTAIRKYYNSQGLPPTNVTLEVNRKWRVLQEPLTTVTIEVTIP